MPEYFMSNMVSKIQMKIFFSGIFGRLTLILFLMYKTACIELIKYGLINQSNMV